MKSRALVIALICALIHLSFGCQKTIERPVIRQELPPTTEEKILSVTLTDGTLVRFNDEGGKYRVQQEKSGPRNSIVGRTETGEFVEVFEDQILEATM